MSTQDENPPVNAESMMAALPPLGLTLATPETVESEKPKTTEITLKKETMRELLDRDVPKPETILAPWLCVGESALVSAKAGVGKTFFGMEVAKAITLTGNAFAGRWTTESSCLVVYLDGEMGAAAMKTRGVMMNLNTEFLIYVDSLNQDETVRINLADPRFQDAVMRLMKDSDAEVLIIDNLATLYNPGENPNSTLYTDALNHFILKLRKEKIAVVIIDHEGKGATGGPRGTSAKTDIAHVAISLERPESASPADGAHFIVRFTKRRGFHGSSSAPFIANLCDGKWDVSDVPDTTSGKKSESSREKLKSEAFRIFDEGGDAKQVMADLGIPKPTAYRYLKDWKAENFGMDSRDTLPEPHVEFDAFAG